MQGSWAIEPGLILRDLFPCITPSHPASLRPILLSVFASKEVFEGSGLANGSN
jgi:hypothetical protein